MLTGTAKFHVRAFIKTVIIGSVAAAAPALLFTLPLGLTFLVGDGNLAGLVVMFAPLFFTVPCVLVGLLLVGLPLTAALARSKKERGEYYVIAGLFFGTAPFLVLMFLPDWGAGFALPAAFGAFGGSITGWVWGRHRDELAASRAPD